MTLATVWISSLIGMAVLALWGAVRARAFEGFSHAHIHGVVKEDLLHVAERAGHLIERMRPRVEEIAVATVVFIVRRGRHVRMLVSRYVFGRIEIERGKASSFFLKRIAEDKGERKSPTAILEDGF